MDILGCKLGKRAADTLLGPTLEKLIQQSADDSSLQEALLQVLHSHIALSYSCVTFCDLKKKGDYLHTVLERFSLMFFSRIYLPFAVASVEGPCGLIASDSLHSWTLHALEDPYLEEMATSHVLLPLLSQLSKPNADPELRLLVKISTDHVRRFNRVQDSKNLSDVKPGHKTSKKEKENASVADSLSSPVLIHFFIPAALELMNVEAKWFPGEAEDRSFPIGTSQPASANTGSSLKIKINHSGKGYDGLLHGLRFLAQLIPLLRPSSSFYCHLLLDTGLIKQFLLVDGLPQEHTRALLQVIVVTFNQIHRSDSLLGSKAPSSVIVSVLPFLSEFLGQLVDFLDQQTSASALSTSNLDTEEPNLDLLQSGCQPRFRAEICAEFIHTLYMSLFASLGRSLLTLSPITLITLIYPSVCLFVGFFSLYVCHSHLRLLPPLPSICNIFAFV